MEDFWSNPSSKKREVLRRKLFTKEGIRSEFVEQLSPETVEVIDPGTISLAWSQISRPGVIDALLDLHLDYRTNVALYSKFHSYFRQYNQPTLIIWGRQDQYCTPAAATAYTRELPDAEIHMIEGALGTRESWVAGNSTDA